MKKILFLIPNLKHGGAEKVLVNLVNNMDRSKYEVTVQTLFDVGVHKASLKPHIRYRSVFPFSFRGNTTLFKLFPPRFLWKHFVGEKYDIAVSYLEGPTSRILGGCTDPETKRCAWIHIELNLPKKAAIGFRSPKEAEQVYNSFDHIICVSKNVKEHFTRSLDIHAPVSVLYNTNETEQIIVQVGHLRNAQPVEALGQSGGGNGIFRCGDGGIPPSKSCCGHSCCGKSCGFGQWFHLLISSASAAI